MFCQHLLISTNWQRTLAWRLPSWTPAWRRGIFGDPSSLVLADNAVRLKTRRRDVLPDLGRLWHILGVPCLILVILSLLPGFMPYLDHLGPIWKGSRLDLSHIKPYWRHFSLIWAILGVPYLIRAIWGLFGRVPCLVWAILGLFWGFHALLGLFGAYFG